MLPNEVFKSVVGSIAVAVISVIMMPSSSGSPFLVHGSRAWVQGRNINLRNHQIGNTSEHSSNPLPAAPQTSTSGNPNYLEANGLKDSELIKKPVQQVFANHNEPLDRANTAKSVPKSNVLGTTGKKRVFNYNFINQAPGETVAENMTASASSQRENWATFQGGTLDDSEDTTVTPEASSSSQPDSDEQANSSGSKQQHQQLKDGSSSNQESRLANEAAALTDSAPESTRLQQPAQQVQLERESFSKSEKPVVRKSSSTLTTIGDGKKKARLVSKSAPLPPGLRRRIIEEFVRKGGNPDNIVISDSTITTTSKSKKKTITTVYKVVPAGGPPSSGGRQAKKMNGKDLASLSMKLRQPPPGKRFKKIMTVTRDEMPKNEMMPNLLERPEKPNTATFTDMGLVEFDDNADEMPTLKPEGLHHKSRRPALKMRLPPSSPSALDLDDDDDEDTPPSSPVSKSKHMMKAGVGGGGVSLNTLMDAIKHMQQQHQGKSKPLELDADLGPADAKEPLDKHLSNFNDFNGHKSNTKKASNLNKHPSKNNANHDEEEEDEESEKDEKERENNTESGGENKQPPEVEQKKISSVAGTVGGASKGSSISSDKVSPEQQLEELKRVVVASTEKLKERRAKSSTSGTGSGATSASPLEAQKTTTPPPTTTARPSASSPDAGSGLPKNNNSSDSAQSNHRGGSKTHNIMMLIDFSHPDKPRAPSGDAHRRSPRAHSARLSPLGHSSHHGHLAAAGGGFFPGASSWFEPDDQWHPLTADAGTNMHLTSHGFAPHAFGSELPVEGLMREEQFLAEGARHQHRMPMALESGDSFGQAFDYMDAATAAAAVDHRARGQRLMSYGGSTRTATLPDQHLYDMTSATHNHHHYHNNHRPSSGPLSALLGGGGQAGSAAPHSLAASAFMSLIHRAPGFHHHNHHSHHMPQRQTQPLKLSAAYSSILPEESRGTNQLINEVIEELVMSASNEIGSLTGSNGTRQAQLYSVSGSPHPTYQLNRRRRRRR